MQTEPSNKNDLRLFLAYWNDLKEYTGKSTYKLSKEANLRGNYTVSIKRILQGKKQYGKVISLNLLIHIAKVHKYPFDLNKYIHLLDLPEEPSKEI
jgi:hypothetical protein